MHCHGLRHRKGRQVLMIPVKQPLDSFAHIGEQVPAVSYLYRIGCTAGYPVCVGGRAIAANDLDPWMLLEPNRQCVSSTIRQEIHRTSPLQVHEDGAICPALLPGPIVYAQDPWRYCVLYRLPPDQP